ncbi:MAG: AraC family transcriptional regulator [Saprospiraceae bacterium]|nr:AraC family transcriptional regulator [Saprospiraceae bacterium]
MYPPLLWFYTRAVTDKTWHINKSNLWHFAPFICFLGILLIPLLGDYNLMTSRHVGYPLIKLIITPVYLVAVLVELVKYRKALDQHYSYKHQMQYKWLSWIVWGAFALWTIACIGYISNILSPEINPILYDYYVLGFLSMYLFVLAIIAFSQTDIVLSMPDNPTHAIAEWKKPENTELYEGYELDVSKIKSAMEDEDAFLDPLLSISRLSELTQIPQYKITLLLNQSLKKSFYEFVNEYRVNKAKQLLASEKVQQYSILGIADESGFNSKASFNRVFKKTTGLTPSQYIKQLTR